MCKYADATKLWEENEKLWFHVTKTWSRTVCDEDILSYAWESCVKAYERTDITTESYRRNYAVYKLKGKLRWKFGDLKKLALNHSYSLDVPMDTTGDMTETWLDRLEAPSEGRADFEFWGNVEEALTSQEFKVVSMWADGFKFNEIAKDFGFSKQYANKIHKNAIEKLQSVF